MYKRQLLLLNETQYVECARALAQRSMQATDSVDRRVKLLIKSVLCREADASELAILKNAYKEQLKQYTKNPAEADKLLAVGESKVNEKLNKVELAALTMVANIVLNLDEAVTK